MATKTQSVMDNLNYFTELKESNPDSFCNEYSEALKDLIGLFGMKVARGIYGEEEIEKFRATLPGTSAIFDKAVMHPDLSFMPGYFDALVNVNQATISQNVAVRKS